jgi:hypothetical protein
MTRGNPLHLSLQQASASPSFKTERSESRIRHNLLVIGHLSLVIPEMKNDKWKGAEKGKNLAPFRV